MFLSCLTFALTSFISSKRDSKSLSLTLASDLCLSV